VSLRPREWSAGAGLDRRGSGLVATSRVRASANAAIVLPMHISRSGEAPVLGRWQGGIINTPVRRRCAASGPLQWRWCLTPASPRPVRAPRSLDHQPSPPHTHDDRKGPAASNRRRTLSSDLLDFSVLTVARSHRRAFRPTTPMRRPLAVRWSTSESAVCCGSKRLGCTSTPVASHFSYGHSAGLVRWVQQPEVQSRAVGARHAQSC
jgi:hypothetical protein